MVAPSVRPLSIIQNENNIMGEEMYRELTKTVYDSEDLTKMLGISVSRLWRIRQQGYLRKLPAGGKRRSVKVPRAEVVRYLESVSAQNSD